MAVHYFSPEATFHLHCFTYLNRGEFIGFGYQVLLYASVGIENIPHPGAIWKFMALISLSGVQYRVKNISYQDIFLPPLPPPSPITSEYCGGYSAGGSRTKTAQELLFARQSVVAHARAFGLDAVDLVDIDYRGNVGNMAEPSWPVWVTYRSSCPELGGGGGIATELTLPEIPAP